MRMILLKEYAVLFVNDVQHSELSYNIKIIALAVYQNGRDFAFWIAEHILWLKRQSFISRFVDRNWEYFYAFYFCLINYVIWKVGRQAVPNLLVYYMDAVEYVFSLAWTEELPVLYKSIFLTIWSFFHVHDILWAYETVMNFIRKFIFSYFVTIPKFWRKQLVQSQPLYLTVLLLMYASQRL